jgi:hypothetical protein
VLRLVPPANRSVVSVVTQYLSSERTDKVVRDIQNLYRHLLGDGFADLSRMPAEVLSEVPKGTVSS